MAIPCIITVAITGSVPQKSDNPAVPITINEQIESTHAAFEAGWCTLIRSRSVCRPARGITTALPWYNSSVLDRRAIGQRLRARRHACAPA